jgi:hypothetical protein
VSDFGSLEFASGEIGSFPCGIRIAQDRIIGITDVWSNLKEGTADESIVLG